MGPSQEGSGGFRSLSGSSKVRGGVYASEEEKKFCYKIQIQAEDEYEEESRQEKEEVTA